MVLEAQGIPTAPYALVKSLDSRLEPEEDHPAAKAIAESRYKDTLSKYPLFAKPAAECTSRGVTGSSKIGSPNKLEKTVRKLREESPDQDILIESFLSGREITLTIVGTGPEACVVAAREFLWQSEGNEHGDHDFYSNRYKTPHCRPQFTHPDLNDPVIIEVRLILGLPHWSDIRRCKVLKSGGCGLQGRRMS